MMLAGNARDHGPADDFQHLGDVHAVEALVHRPVRHDLVDNKFNNFKLIRTRFEQDIRLAHTSPPASRLRKRI